MADWRAVVTASALGDDLTLLSDVELNEWLENHDAIDRALEDK